MFGLFSKRKRAPADDAQRIIPVELWEGDIGRALKDAGLSPDDDANLLPVLPADARTATARAAHEARLAEENLWVGAMHPGCSVTTQFILTGEVWDGRHAELLRYVLELTPYDAFNTRFLPADEASAAALELPVFHDGSFARVLQVADAHIDLIVQRAGLTDIVDAREASDAVKEAMRGDLAELATYYYEEAMLPALRGEG